jgi:hypothetical protein
MAVNEKYAQKYIITNDVIRIAGHGKSKLPNFYCLGKDLGGVNFSFRVEPILAPTTVMEETLVHNFAEWWGFFGSNPEDVSEFDAEIWVYMGANREKSVITAPAAVYVAPGTMHGPWLVKRVGKPIFFYHGYERPIYKKQVVPTTFSEIVQG